MNPLFVRINGADNVGIIVNPEGVGRGAEFSNGLTAAETIPQSHKIALESHPRGAPVYRYGFAIGHANRDVLAGEWVRETLLDMPEAPPLEALALSTAVPAPQAPLTGYTFDGFRNSDGTVGTRNILGITTTVQCVAPTVDHAVRRIRTEILPHFPNVDDVVAITHSYGCGVAIDAPGAAIPIRTIRHISQNPNIGGDPLVVSLGCEKLQPQRLFGGGLAITLPILEAGNIIRLQDERGFAETVSAILRAAEKRLAVLNRRERQTCSRVRPDRRIAMRRQRCFLRHHLQPRGRVRGGLARPRRGHGHVFGSDRDSGRGSSAYAACGDAPSGSRSDPRDALVRRVSGAGKRGPQRQHNARQQARRFIEHRRKGAGSVAKAGTTPLNAVATHGERVTAKGLVFAATPASDFICGTQQLASMNLHVFTTGEGSPYGLSLVPVVKVSSRTALAEKWPDLIDIDAGPVATGERSIEEMGWQLFRFYLEVASGRKTWAEHWKLGNSLSPFNPGPVT